MKVVSHNGQSEESVLCHVFKLKHPVIAKIIREDVSKKTGFLQKISAKKSLPLIHLQNDSSNINENNDNIESPFAGTRYLDFLSYGFLLFQNPRSTYFCYVGVERSYLTYMFPFSGWTLCPSFTQLSYNWLTLLYVDIKDSFIVHHFATRCNWGEKCIVCNFPRILAPTTKRTHFWSCPSNSTLIVSVIDCNYSYPPSCIINFYWTQVRS